MREKLEKIIKFNIDKGKDWEEIEQIVLKKSTVLGIPDEECKLILESNKPIEPTPEEEIAKKEEEDIKKINTENSFDFDLLKSLITIQFKIIWMQLKIFGWMITFGGLIKTKHVIDTWNKLNPHPEKK